MNLIAIDAIRCILHETAKPKMEIPACRRYLSSWAFLVVGILVILPVAAPRDLLTPTLSPATQTLPISTAADWNLVVSGMGTDTYHIELDVLTGPDAGLATPFPTCYTFFSRIIR